MIYNMRRKNVVLLNGSATCGKNTFVEQLSSIVKVEHWSTVDKYKDILKQFFPLEYNEEHKTDHIRQFLSEFKALSTKYFNDPYNETMKKIFEFFESPSDAEILFIDIREPEEIQKILNRFSNDEVVTLLIDNPNKECNMSNNSDANVFDFTYDWIVVNDGTIEDLKENAKIFYENLFPHYVLIMEEEIEGNEEDAPNI